MRGARRISSGFVMNLAEHAGQKQPLPVSLDAHIIVDTAMAVDDAGGIIEHFGGIRADRRPVAVDFDFGEVTQEVDGQPKMNWQVSYDERVIEESEGNARYAFFFHYLDLKKPLLTSSGSITLPEPTKAPAHLKSFVYESP